MRSQGWIPLATFSFGVVVAMGLTACSTSPSPTTSTADASKASSTAPSSLVSDSANAIPVITPFGRLPTNDVAASSAGKLQQVLDKSVAEGIPAVLAAVLTPHGMWAG